MSSSSSSPPISVAGSATQVERVYTDLNARIADGRLKRGDRLPSERQLCADLAVSRMTLRRALALMREEGTLHSVQGSGTYVTSPVLGETPNDVRGFSRLAQARGLSPSAELLDLDQHPASIEEAERCSIAPGSIVVAVERIRKLDGIPVAVSASLVPLACAPSLLDVDWATASLYDELTIAGNKPVRADYAIEAQGADHTTANLLNVTVGQPVLVTMSTAFAADGRVVEVSRMTFRGDRYRFRATVSET